jgi:VIT1/CCC1 family predicted Fe2+/Mn2+ transporter
MLSEKARELEEIDNDMQAEKDEMVKIYVELGENQKDSEEIVDILATNKDGFLDVMMIEELGLSSDDENPLTNSVVTFFAFGIFGLMPLLPFVVAKGSKLPWSDTYVWVSAILTVIFLFILGFSKSLIVLSRWWYSGLEAVFIGGLSAGVAYGIGAAFGENNAE